MITLRELLVNCNTDFPPPIEHQVNLLELLKRISMVRSAYGKPMIVTSGYRSLQHHIDIYTKKGISPDKIPMASQHLKGAAVDIYDKDGSLYKWCKANEHILEEVGLWCEEDTSQPRVHFQIFPPKSEKRWFIA